VRITVAIVETALGGSLTEGGQSPALAGLVVVPLAEAVGLMGLIAFLKRALPDGDLKQFETCDVGNAVLQGLTGPAPLLVVAVT